MKALISLALVLTVACSADSGDSGDGDSDPGCPSATPAEILECIEIDRYQVDLEFIAAERSPGTSHWQDVQDMISDRLTDLGFTTSLDTYTTGVNVIGILPGTSRPDEQVFVTAHYDSTVGCAGADDNATGVAGALELARTLSARTHDRTLVLGFWDEEERGLIGADDYARRAEIRGDEIVGVFNFEMIGYKTTEPDSQEVPAGFELIFPDAVEELEQRNFAGDFLAIISNEPGEVEATAVDTWADQLGLDSALLVAADGILNIAPDLSRSDHAAFWNAGYPAMMLTDTANLRYEHYHCLSGEQDTVDRLDPDFTNLILRATTAAVTETLAAP